MNAGKVSNTSKNRRRSFRIYEQVDLFYQTIDTAPEPTETQETLIPAPSSLPGSTDTEQSLPESHCGENETLNANISANGISFTCKEELHPGDYLMIRILMLSGMTFLTSCCKIVYCRPSNPFEPDQYPYTVGAQFINLRTEDQALLKRFIHKKRLRQLIVWGLLATFILALLLLPELIFELAFEAIDMAVDSLLEAIFMVNDLIGYGLDQIAGTFFPDDLRKTQITSFYMQFVLYILLALFITIRVLPVLIKTLTYKWQVFYFRKKSSLAYFWNTQGLFNKALMISASIAIPTAYISFFL